MIRHCYDTPRYDLYRIPFVSSTCVYDLYIKPEEVKYTKI